MPSSPYLAAGIRSILKSYKVKSAARERAEGMELREDTAVVGERTELEKWYTVRHVILHGCR